MGTPAPDPVKRLVDRFDQARKIFLSGGHQAETRNRGSVPLSSNERFTLTRRMLAGMREK